jgi:hypothetical protein
MAVAPNMIGGSLLVRCRLESTQTFSLTRLQSVPCISSFEQGQSALTKLHARDLSQVIGVNSCFKNDQDHHNTTNCLSQHGVFDMVP